MKKLLVILLLCSSAFGQFQQKPMLGEQINWAHPLSKGLVGLWLFNEGTGGKVYDLSGNGNTGDFSGDIAWVPCKFGPGVTLDGDEDFITVSNIKNFSGSGSICMWVLPDNTNTEYLFDSDGHDLLCFRDATDIYLYPNFGGDSGDVLQATVALGTGSWKQVVAVFDDATNELSIYVDGLLIATDSAQAWSAATVTNMIFGRNADSVNYSWTGDFDNISVYNRVLSASEIALLYREPFCMVVQDDIALMATAAAPPSVVPTPYYYRGEITIPLMSFVLFGLCYYSRRWKCAA